MSILRQYIFALALMLSIGVHAVVAFVWHQQDDFVPPRIRVQIGVASIDSSALPGKVTVDFKEPPKKSEATIEKQVVPMSRAADVERPSTPREISIPPWARREFLLASATDAWNTSQELVSRVLELSRLEAPTQPVSVASQASTGARVDSLPVKLPGNPAPPYPPDALVRNQEGTVILRVRLGADGIVQALSVHRSSQVDSLDESALATVRRWQFEPARRNGLAVPYEFGVPIVFSLRDR